VKVILFLFILFLPSFALAGNIDLVDQYAWSEKIGWVNFGATTGNVEVTDSKITGHAWSSLYGWINLCPANGCVLNDGSGILSGNAWGENTGYIDFAGVTIDSKGFFIGFATGDVTGQINFNCINNDTCGSSEFRVRTAWRVPSDPSGGGTTGSAASGQNWLQRQGFLPLDIMERIPEIFQPLIPVFLRPTPSPTEPAPLTLEEVPKITPLVFQGTWQLLPLEPIYRFVFAPLPRGITRLADKFPQLAKTLEQVGISRITDLEKLQSVKLTLPGFAQFTQLGSDIPTEVVFASIGLPRAELQGDLIDVPTILTVNEQGEPQQKITTIAGKLLRLTVKPGQPAKSVKGYVVFRSKKSQALQIQGFQARDLLASAFFAKPTFAQAYKPEDIETALVLLEFEYTDPDGDGIYTAEIQVPIIEGEYEILTVIEYEDEELGTRIIRLLTVVDPEGYVYRQSGSEETRVANATVSLFWLNSQTNSYELWPAKDFQQENPQVTDVTGKYSFLTPEGSYYIRVEAPGYVGYEEKAFEVREGSGIHINIELKTKYWWLSIFDWKMFVMIIFGILLFYNFYRDKIRKRNIST